MPWLTTLAVIGVIAVLVVIMWIPVAATSTPSYCSSCKATKKAGQTWQTSVHSKVNCTQCHVQPGIKNQIAWRSKEWLNIWADYLNVPRVDQQGDRPTNGNCTPCHDLKTIASVHGDVKMPHDRHVTISGLVCADCHDKVSHGTRADAGKVSMTVCGMCHQQQIEQNDCSFCHVKQVAPSDPHPDDYIAEHGKEALQDEAACLRCHHDSAAFCDSCHARPTPDHFSGTWRYTHGAEAKKDRAGCLGCHSEQDFCQECHQVSHPDDWLQTHGKVAGEGGGSCLTCHPQAMCDSCHEGRS